MVIDPNLALKIGQYGGTQMPDYGNMLAQATNIQGARQTQQMNALKMQEEALAKQQQQQANALIPQFVDEKGNFNQAGYISALARTPGLASLVQGQVKAGLENEAKRAAINKDAAAAAQNIVQSNVAKIKTSQQLFSAVKDQKQHDATLAELTQLFGPEWAGKFPTVYDPKDPEWRRLQLLDPKELIPSTIVIDLDGVTKTVTLDKLTGKPIRTENYEVQPYSAEVQAQRESKARQGASKTIVDIAGNKAAEEGIKELYDFRRVNRDTPSLISSLRQAKAQIPQAVLGTGAEPFAAFANFTRNFLGVEIAPGTKITEEINSKLFDSILSNLRKLDAQPTQQQQAALKQAMGSISTDPKALEKIIDFWDKKLTDRIREYNKQVEEAKESGVRFVTDPLIKLQPRIESENDQRAYEWLQRNPNHPDAAKIAKELGL